MFIDDGAYTQEPNWCVSRPAGRRDNEVHEVFHNVMNDLQPPRSQVQILRGSLDFPRFLR